MRKWMVGFAVLGFSLAVFVGAALAEELIGKIQKVDQDQKLVILEDGTELWASDGTPLDQLREGAKVKAMYQEKEGKKVVTSLEVVTE